LHGSKEPGEAESEVSLSHFAAEDVLRLLGFHEDTNVLSDFSPGLSFDFGNVKLEASHNRNRWLRPVILLGGVMTTSRSIALVHFEMPTEVESFEQGVAFVTYCLDKHADGNFAPAVEAPWLEAGRRYRHLLPWNSKQ
jgi:hypothetical protein